MAWALTRVAARRRLRLAIALALGGSLALSLVNVWLVPKTPWRAVAAAVQARVAPEDSVWVDELAVPAFDYYTGGLAGRHVLAARDMEALAGTPLPAGKIWFVVQAGRYRNPLDFLPALATVCPWRTSQSSSAVDIAPF